MLVEPKGVVNTGEAESDLTASNDVWIQSSSDLSTKCLTFLTAVSTCGICSTFR